MSSKRPPVSFKRSLNVCYLVPEELYQTFISFLSTMKKNQLNTYNEDSKNFQTLSGDNDDTSPPPILGVENDEAEDNSEKIDEVENNVAEKNDKEIQTEEVNENQSLNSLQNIAKSNVDIQTDEEFETKCMKCGGYFKTEEELSNHTSKFHKGSKRKLSQDDSKGKKAVKLNDSEAAVTRSQTANRFRAQMGKGVIKKTSKNTRRPSKVRDGKMKQFTFSRWI